FVRGELPATTPEMVALNPLVLMLGLDPARVTVRVPLMSMPAASNRRLPCGGLLDWRIRPLVRLPSAPLELIASVPKSTRTVPWKSLPALVRRNTLLCEVPVSSKTRRERAAPPPIRPERVIVCPVLFSADRKLSMPVPLPPTDVLRLIWLG